MAALVVLVVRQCPLALTTAQTATAAPASATLCAQALSSATQVVVAVRVSRVWVAAAPLMAGVLVVAVTEWLVHQTQAVAAVVVVALCALA